MEVFFDSIQYVLAQPWWIDVAKIVLGTIMLIVALAGIIISIRFSTLCDELVLLEKLADHTRDDTMFELTAARARMSKVRQTLEARKRNPPTIDVQALIAENVVPILALLTQRERTLAQLGVLVGKIGMTAISQVLRQMKGK